MWDLLTPGILLGSIEAMKYLLKTPKKIFINYASSYENDVERFIKRGSLLSADVEAFELELIKEPRLGVVVQGTGGLRKVRLKSATSGKRGGFRVCYYYYVIKSKIVLIAIYGKNEQDDLTQDERRKFRKIIDGLKREDSDE